MKLGRAVEFLKGLCRARRVIDRHAVIGSRVFLELIPVHLGRQSGSPFLSSPLPPPLPLYPFPRKEGNGTGEKESLSTFRWRLRIRRTFDINYRIIPLMLYPRVKAADRRTLRRIPSFHDLCLTGGTKRCYTPLSRLRRGAPKIGSRFSLHSERVDIPQLTERVLNLKSLWSNQVRRWINNIFLTTPFILIEQYL